MATDRRPPPRQFFVANGGRRPQRPPLVQHLRRSLHIAQQHVFDAGMRSEAFFVVQGRRVSLGSRQGWQFGHRKFKLLVNQSGNFAFRRHGRSRRRGHGVLLEDTMVRLGGPTRHRAGQRIASCLTLIMIYRIAPPQENQGLILDRRSMSVMGFNGEA